MDGWRLAASRFGNAIMLSFLLPDFVFDKSVALCCRRRRCWCGEKSNAAVLDIFQCGENAAARSFMLQGVHFLPTQCSIMRAWLSSRAVSAALLLFSYGRKCAAICSRWCASRAVDLFLLLPFKQSLAMRHQEKITRNYYLACISYLFLSSILSPENIIGQSFQDLVSG
jgi:hypothetical protein